MKRVYLIILMALIAMTGFAQAQPQTGDVIYVYQKDGDIKSFLRDEIKEFYYGMEDEDGVTQNEPVMQWIVLEDSICKIPLANIDSVSFVTPATVYQPGVIRIEEGLMQYVADSDSLTINFAANTPANLMPNIGDILVTIEMNDKLPYGFMGRVKKVSGTTVMCDAVSMSDVFKTFYYTSETNVSSDEAANVRTRAGQPFVKEINLPEWKHNATDDIALKIFPIDDLALKGTTEVEFSVKPKLTVRSSFIINNLKTTIDLSFKGDIDVMESYGLYGGLEFVGEFGPPVGLPICPVAPGVYLYWKPGIYLQFALMASIKGIAKQHFVVERSFHASLQKGIRDNTAARITSSDFEIEGCVDGTIGIGGFVELGVTGLCSELDKICARAELGIEQTGHIVLYNKDIAEAQKINKVYEALKASEITTSVVLNTVATAEAPLLSYTKHLPLSFTWPIRKYDLVPTFSDVEFSQCYSPRTSADVSMVIKGNCFKPVKVGYQIVDENGKEIVKSFATDKYQKNGMHWQTRADGLEDDGDYVVSPMVNFLGFDLLAYPTMGIEKNPFPVRIVSFEQTGSKYSKQKGFEYEGRNYFYKFNARTTVELSDKAEKVKDWGYVYVDFYGEHKKISCANLGGRTYPDVRYAYYYNEPKRTVELYPYVQFEGEAEIQKGKSKIYPVEYILNVVSSCPDDNHPHLIDLGLPSGTLWSCTNVGANDPEGDGYYFKWGETKKTGDIEFNINNIPASYYNYEFYNAETREFIDIGPDISGTKYDAARVNWGSPWLMPTKAQVQELSGNCYTEMVKSNDVIGVKVQGPNGHCIFLRTPDEDVDEIDFGDYTLTSEIYQGMYLASTLYSPIVADFWAAVYEKIPWHKDSMYKYGFSVVGAVNGSYYERIHKENLEEDGTFCSPRFFGMLVRPVAKKKK